MPQDQESTPPAESPLFDTAAFYVPHATLGSKLQDVHGFLSERASLIADMRAWIGVQVARLQDEECQLREQLASLQQEPYNPGAFPGFAPRS